MGTKNDPGKFDCYASAEPDEPVFVLLGRDPAAALAITFWCAVREHLRDKGVADISDEKIDEALAHEDAMYKWAEAHGKKEALDVLSRASWSFESTGASCSEAST
jgi:hypothetical protein